MSAVAVTVCGDRRRRDLTLPRAVPLAELLPSIAAEIDGSATTDATLSTVAGEPLDVGLSADEIGVYDGQVLLLRQDSSGAAVRVFDDPAAAIAARTTTGGTLSAELAAVLTAVLGVATVSWWLSGLEAVSAATLATGLVVAAGCYPFIPSLCLRIGRLPTRLDLPHDSTSLAREEAAVRRASTLTRALEWTTRIAVGLGSGLLTAVSGPATIAIACCALVSTTLRQRLSPAPVTGAVVVLAATYAGVVLSPLVLSAPLDAAQMWLLAAVTVTAIGLRTIHSRPMPGLSRIAAVMETISRSALPALLLWLWGANDVVLALVRP